MLEYKDGLAMSLTAPQANLLVSEGLSGVQALADTCQEFGIGRRSGFPPTGRGPESFFTLVL